MLFVHLLVHTRECMPTVPFHWEPFGGGVLNMDDGRGEDLPREAEG